jgi:two-component system chemotaxis sensor kinase CheA
MQPIGAVFSKFPRVVRDLSAKLGKQCEVQMDGKEVEVDKTILEAIGDPLTHLVRNSLDHGVESPDVRAAAGKSTVGTIQLRAYHQAGKVRIDVADDGGGIAPEKLKSLFNNCYWCG